MIATNLMEKNNSASRLLRLFQDNHGRQQNTQVLSVWAEAFELPSGLQTNDMVVEATSLLSAADAELNAIKTTLLGKGVPEGLVVPYIERARCAVSPTLLNTTWNNVSQHFAVDTLLAFQWFAYELNEDAQVLNPEDVTKLLTEMADLEVELMTAELSVSLRQFLLSHLKLMQTALRQSRVAGARPLQKAVRTTQHECELESEHLQEEVQASAGTSAAKKVMEGFVRVWKGAVEVCGDAEKLQKGAKVIGGAVTALLEYLG